MQCSFEYILGSVSIRMIGAEGIRGSSGNSMIRMNWGALSRGAHPEAEIGEMIVLIRGGVRLSPGIRLVSSSTWV